MRGWIPPLPLALGALAYGASWLVLFAYAQTGNLVVTFLGLGWVHTVALAWITTIALAILIHALPTFTDVEWTGVPANIARTSSVIFALAAYALVLGFIAQSPSLLEIAGSIALAALGCYFLAAFQPIGRAMRSADRIDRAVTRAFTIVLAMLVVTACLGALFTFVIGGKLSPSLLLGVPLAHAILGIGGWLTLLVVGVSARTMRPICGVKSRNPRSHVLFSSALLVGTIVAASGALLNLGGLLLTGCALLFLGTLAYAIDIADILLRATVPHRTPQLFMGAAATWAVIAALLLCTTAFGISFARAAAYAALIGWVGSAVLAHLHHIGIRVVLTSLRGEDDITRPQVVLNAPLSFTTLALYELAALLGTVAFITNASALLAIAALSGFTSFLALAANVVYVATKSAEQSASTMSP